jgi:hypothetical protein
MRDGKPYLRDGEALAGPTNGGNVPPELGLGLALITLIIMINAIA